MKFENVMIIGASRGLGRALALFCGTHLEGIKNVQLVSRKMAALEETKRMMAVEDIMEGRRPLAQAETSCLAADMSSEEGARAIGALLEKSDFDLVIYAAGGGPHGVFQNKEWKDHLWSLRVGLVTPMVLVHHWLRARDPRRAGRFVAVGSRIAEQDPDPLASSYAAGKHGLLGFVSSLQDELSQNENKVWLFSPGYMDSEMLPLTAKVRHDGSKLMSVSTAAQALLRWIKKDEGNWHRVIN